VPTLDEASAALLKNHPLLHPWSGPFGGVPPFGRFRVEELGPALEAATAGKLSEALAIANDPAPPSFENTIAALERSGQPLRQVMAVYGIYTTTLKDDAVQALEREFAPKLMALQDTIIQSSRLFERIAKVYAARERPGIDAGLNAPPDAGLNAEQRRLVWVVHSAFAREGARLDAAQKQTLFDLNQALAQKFTAFSQNILAEENEQVVWLGSEAMLDGLPTSLRQGAKAEAERHGKPELWAIANTRSTVDPFLTFSKRRELRERVWRMFTNRGDNGGARDNNALISEILALRARRAALLGYSTHAHWRLDDAMAKVPERAMKLLEDVWRPAVVRVREEVRDMQRLVDAEGSSFAIAPWDYLHYAEKVRLERYDLDQSELTPYLQLEKLREGMFYVAQELFGLHFAPVDDGSVPVYHPDVRVFRVEHRDRGVLGLWFFDPYARPGKISGAWMSEYRTQRRLDGVVLPIVSNNANFVEGAKGAPVLISWDDARTLFHEFGHALHGLLSNVTYPTLAGTAVATDYVEFPSQVLERWLSTPELLSRFAIHAETGEALPPALFEKLTASETFNQGFHTLEYLASALIDLKLHLSTDAAIDPKKFERETLASLGMPSELVMRHRTAHFQHVFAGDGYAAGYYSYLWADTVAADAYEAFVEGEGPFDRTVAARLAAHVFSVGNTVDPSEGYRAFRGRDPSIAALMRKRGFPVA
jgi:peptidyl-dipeptidase Dcp